MLKHSTVLALALVGGALFFLGQDQDTNRCGQTLEVVRNPTSPEGQRLPRLRLQVADADFDNPASTSAPQIVRTRVVIATGRTSAFSLRARLAELQARVRDAIATLQAEECCWLNSLGQHLRGKSQSGSSPAWRDLHYDAQALARMLGFCRQEPV
jgi:hypothetical protein